MAPRRSRRHARGAVLVEALVVSAVLTMFLGGVVFAHRLGWKHLRALRAARSLGMMQATHGCDRAVDSGQVLARSDLEGLTVEPPGKGTAIDKLQPPTSPKGTEEGRASVEDASRSVGLGLPKAVLVRARGAVAVQTGASATDRLTAAPRSTTYLLCNDEPKAGNVTAILGVAGKFSFGQ